MTGDTVVKAKHEAHRFLAAVKAWQARVKEDSYVASGFSSKEGGALRRASMDLTRALADMRRR